jgi:hypothetical protein
LRFVLYDMLWSRTAVGLFAAEPSGFAPSAVHEAFDPVDFRTPPVDPAGS